MQYGHIDGIDKPISRLVQGTVYFNESNASEGLAIYDEVFAAGGNTFDTAHTYGGGACERVFGRWLMSRGVRDQVVIIGKGAHPMEGRNRVTPADITSDIFVSLNRLDVEMMDIYLLHRDDPSVPVEPIVDILNEHRRAGRIGAFGGSNWSHERIAAANAYARASGQTSFAATSPQLSIAAMVNPTWDGCISIGGAAGAAARGWYLHNNVAVFTWSSLAGGFMTGKYRRDNLASFSEYFDTVTIHAYADESNFLRLERAEQLAARKGVSLPQLSLAYVLCQPLNVFALIGARASGEFAANTFSGWHSTTAEDIAWVDNLTAS